jgi:hypothetical protein
LAVSKALTEPIGSIEDESYEEEEGEESYEEEL